MIYELGLAREKSRPFVVISLFNLYAYDKYDCDSVSPNVEIAEVDFEGQPERAQSLLKLRLRGHQCLERCLDIQRHSHVLARQFSCDASWRGVSHMVSR
jgi:hypothetical protein